MERIWDELAYLGAPLTTLEAVEIPATEASLKQILAKAVADLKQRPEQPAHFRKQQALESFLLSLHDYYPAVFKTFDPEVRDMVPTDVEGRHIKMRRIATARLAEWL